MRVTTLCLLVIGMLLPDAIRAQAPPELATGDSIRFSTASRDPWTEALVRELRDDILVLSVGGSVVTVPRSQLARLEVLRSSEFDGQGAARGATIGLLIGVATGAATREPVAGFVVAGLGVPAGAAFGGGGRRAVRGARNGLLIGGASGALLALAFGDHDGCGGDAWVCVGPGGAALLGGGLGAIAGGYLGAWIGALAPTRTWERVTPTGLSLAPTRRGGLALSMSLAW